MGTLDIPEQHPCCCDSIHLTQREIDVLRVIASGKTNPEAARQLGLSPRTVDSHVAAMLRKAAVRNRGELLVVAVARGIIDLSAGTPRWTGRSCLPAPPQPAPPQPVPPQPGPAEPPL
jgi:DNA-binding CsgD family transcriptional regulator